MEGAISSRKQKARQKLLRKKLAFWARFAKCPHCHYHYLKAVLEKHIVACRPELYPLPEMLPIRSELPKPPIVRIKLIDQVSCPKCHSLMPSCVLEGHIAEKHTPANELDNFLKSAKRFPFKFLPPGQLLKAIENLSRQHSNCATDEIYDKERLRRIVKLGPSACYIGVEMWKGYVAFEFQNSGKAVLESPRTGNATYILNGEWRAMISSTKSELRSEYRQSIERIIHSARWEERVQTALFSSRNGRLSRMAGSPNRG